MAQLLATVLSESVAGAGLIALAGEYAKLKQALAIQFKHDRELYTDAKIDCIRQVL